jgi:hypothetical protein
MRSEKLMPRVTAGVAQKSLSAQRPSEPGIGLILLSFTGNQFVATLFRDFSVINWFTASNIRD